jgi:hypothetical protein
VRAGSLKLLKAFWLAATVSVCAFLPIAAASTDMKSVFESVGVTADTKVDVTVFTRQGVCEGFGLVVMGNRKDWPRFELASALANLGRSGRLCPNWPRPDSGPNNTISPGLH